MFGAHPKAGFTQTTTEALARLSMFDERQRRLARQRRRRRVQCTWRSVTTRISRMLRS